MKINIIYVNNGVGLTRDAGVIMEALPHCDFNLIDIYKPSLIRNADINIFLEVVDPQFQNFKLAPINYYIPNPEWYSFAWDKHLHNFDAVLCKTHDTERIFKSKGCKTIFTSFTSNDRHIEFIDKQKLYLHSAGQSDTKGTMSLYSHWLKSTGLTELILMKHKAQLQSTDSISVIPNRMDEDEFKILQNFCGVHICPSQYEGFGHYINEARSTGAIIITTGAAPMNELVSDEYGYFLPVKSKSPMSLATLQNFDPTYLDGIINTIEGLTDKEMSDKSRASRQAFVENDIFFKKQIKQIIK